MLGLPCAQMKGLSVVESASINRWHSARLSLSPNIIELRHAWDLSKGKSPLKSHLKGKNPWHALRDRNSLTIESSTRFDSILYLSDVLEEFGQSQFFPVEAWNFPQRNQTLVSIRVRALQTIPIFESINPTKWPEKMDVGCESVLISFVYMDWNELDCKFVNSHQVGDCQLLSQAIFSSTHFYRVVLTDYPQKSLHRFFPAEFSRLQHVDPRRIVPVLAVILNMTTSPPIKTGT